MLDNDPVLPCQLDKDAPRLLSHFTRPGQRLAWAMLRWARVDIEGYCLRHIPGQASGARRRVRFESAWEWMESEDLDYEFSFLNCCSHTGSDARVMRKEFTQMRAVAARTVDVSLPEVRGLRALHLSAQQRTVVITELEKKMIVKWERQRERERITVLGRDMVIERPVPQPPRPGPKPKPRPAVQPKPHPSIEEIIKDIRRDRPYVVARDGAAVFLQAQEQQSTTPATPVTLHFEGGPLDGNIEQWTVVLKANVKAQFTTAYFPYVLKQQHPGNVFVLGYREWERIYDENNG